MSVTKKPFRLLSMLVLVMCGDPAWAMETDFGVAAKIEYSDNADLVPDNEQTEWERGAIFGFSLVENTDRVFLDMRAVAEYRNFKNNTFDDDWRGDGSLQGAWHIYPQQLRWEVEDYFTTLLQDSAAPDTPDNQTNVNVISTGPVATFRISPVARTELGAHYSRFSYENDPQDSDRVQGVARYFHRHRASLESSLNAVVEDVDFDDESVVPDYVRGDLFIGGSSSNPLNTWTVNVGYSHIDRNRENAIDGFLGRLNWRRYFRTTSYVDINAYTQYTDTGTNLLNAGEQNRAVDAASEQVSGDLFYDKRMELTYHLGTVNRSWNISAELRDEDYETEPNDRQTARGRVNFNVNRSAALTTGAFVEFTRYDYLDQNQKDNDSRVGLGLNYRLNRTLSLVGEYQYNNRESTDDASDYSENRVMFYIYYGRDPLSYRVTPI